MVASVRVAGAHVDFSANANPYQAGVNRAIASNRQFAGSFGGITGQLDRFRASLTSSLVATAAYAAGVGAVSRAVGGSSREFLAYEQGLIGVQKTAGLTDAQTRRLGEGIRNLTTEASLLGGPLPVARQDLQNIAVVAGQMNITGTRNILEFTETVGLLGLTTDLVGEQAANAIGRIIATTSTGVDEVLNLGSALTALGNQFRGGEAEIISQAQFLATQTAAFNLPTQDVLAYSAALAAGGQRAETAGTAFQRLFQTLTDAAAEAAAGDFTRLGVIVQNIDGEVGSLEERVVALRDAIQSGDYQTGLLQFLQALRDAGPEGTLGIFTTLFGGETPPTRLAGIFGFLSQNLDEVDRAIRIANSSWEEQVALLEEAGLFAEARLARLLVVQNQIRDQGVTIGNALTALFVPIAENFRLIEVGAISVGSALAVGFTRRRIEAARQTAQATRTAALESQRSARQALLNSKLRLNAIGLELAAFSGAERDRDRLNRRRERAEQRVTEARRNLASANARVAATATRAARASALFGRAVAFLGGPLGIATLAITAVATSFAVFAEEADNTIEDVLTRLREFQDQARTTRLGLTVEGRFGEDIQRAIDQIRETLRTSPLQATLDITEEDLRRRGLSQGEARRVARQSLARIALLRDEEVLTANATIEELQEGARELGLTINESGNVAVTAIGRIRREFRPLNTTLIQSVQQVRTFSEQLRDAADDETLRVRLQTVAVTDQPTPTIRRFRELQDEQTLIVIAEQRRRDRAVRDSLEREAQLRRDLAIARSAIEDQGLQFGTTAAKLAEQQVSAIERQLRSAQLRTETARRARDLAAETLRIDRERLIIQARAERQAEIDLVLSTRTRPDLVDELALFRDEERRIQELRNAFADQQRDAEQRAAAGSAGRVAGAGLRAQFEIENQLADESRRAEQALAAARQQRFDATVRLLGLRHDLRSASDEEVDQILNAIRAEDARRAGAEEEIEAQSAIIEILRDLVPAYSLTADRARQFAESQERATLIVERLRRSQELLASRRGVEDDFSGFQRRIDLQRISIEQERSLATVGERAAAGLRARFEVENNYLEAQHTARIRLRDALRSESDARSVLDELQARLLSATGDQRVALAGLVEEQRRHVAEAGSEVAGARAVVGATEGLRDEYESLIEILAELYQSQIAVEQIQERLTRGFESQAASLAGRRGVEDDFAGLQRRVDLRRVSIEQERSLATVGEQASAGLRARFEIENDYLEAQHSARLRLRDALRSESDARLVLEDLQARLLSATGDQRVALAGLVEEQRRRVSETGSEVSGARAAVVAVGELRDEYESLIEILAELYQSQIAVERIQERLTRGFEFQASSLAGRRGVEDDFAGLQRRVDLRRVSIEQERSLATVGEQASAGLRARFEIENDYLEAQHSARLRLRDALRSESDARLVLEDLQARLLSATGDQRVALAGLVEEQRRRVSETGSEVSGARAAVVAVGELRDEYESLIEILAELYQSQIAVERIQERLTRGFEFQASSLAGRRGVEDELVALQRRADLQRTSIEQERILATVSDRTAAGLRARFEVENNYLEAQHTARIRLRDALRSESDARSVLDELQARLLSATGDQRVALAGLVEEQRKHVAGIEAEVAGARAVTVALEGQHGGYVNLADVLANLAEIGHRGPLQRLIDDARTLDDTLENVAAGGVQTFGDELASVFRDGTFEIERFIDSVLGDLIDRLIQTNITAPLAEAAQSFLGIGGDVGETAAGTATAAAITTAGTAAAAAITTAGTAAATATTTAGTASGTTIATAITTAAASLATSTSTAGASVAAAITGAGTGVAAAISAAGVAAAAAISAAGAGAGILGVLHSGGIVGPPQRLPSFQRRSFPSSLRRNERFAILEDDEEVLTRRDPRHRWNFGRYSRAEMAAWVRGLPRYHEGGVVGGDTGSRSGMMSNAQFMPGGVDVRITNRSQRAELEATDVDVDINGGRFIVDIVVDDLNRRGPIAQGVARIAQRRA